MPPGTGLSALLAGHVTSGVVRPLPGVRDLHVLCAGPPPPNPQELLLRPAFAALLHELARRYAHVIVDTSAGVDGADAALVAARAGATVVVGRRGASRLRRMRLLIDRLGTAGARIAGVVMNER